MAITKLPVIAQVITHDSVTETDNRRDLREEELLYGWVRGQTLTTQQFNAAMHLLSSYSSPVAFAPYLQPTSIATEDNAVEWVDGATLVQADTPELFEYYGATMPALGTPPTGWKYVVRRQ